MAWKRSLTALTYTAPGARPALIRPGGGVRRVQAVPAGPGRELGAVPEAQTVAEPFNSVVHGVPAHVQPGADLAVGEALRDERDEVEVAAHLVAVGRPPARVDARRQHLQKAEEFGVEVQVHRLAAAEQPVDGAEQLSDRHVRVDDAAWDID